MTGLEIALLIVGVSFFIGSFFVVEKLSSSDLETIQKMSDKEINIMLEKQLDAASGKIERALETRYNEALNKFDRETNRRTTEEIFSISEHGDSVSETLDEKLRQMGEEYEVFEKAHKEIVFLHSMLSDKQERVSKLEEDALLLESNLRNMKRSVEEAIERLYAEQKIKVAEPTRNTQINQQAFREKETSGEEKMEAEPLEAMKPSVEETVLEEPSLPVVSSPKPISSPVYKSENPGSVNEKIISMHREGFSDVDIARSLGKGVGEIRLVLGLFDEGDKP